MVLAQVEVPRLRLRNGRMRIHQPMKSPNQGSATPFVRTGQGSTRLTREEFEKRYWMQFYDPAFDEMKEEIARLTEIAWEAYQDGRKSARTRLAGSGFADPGQELSVEWLDTRTAIQKAEELQKSGEGDSRILVICGSPRTDETCPSEMSKTFRIALAVREQIQNAASVSLALFLLSESRPWAG